MTVRVVLRVIVRVVHRVNVTGGPPCLTLWPVLSLTTLWRTGAGALP